MKNKAIKTIDEKAREYIYILGIQNICGGGERIYLYSWNLESFTKQNIKPRALKERFTLLTT